MVLGLHIEYTLLYLEDRGAGGGRSCVTPTLRLVNLGNFPNTEMWAAADGDIDPDLPLAVHVAYEIDIFQEDR